MDKINKTAIEIELRTGASLMPGDYGAGMSVGLGFTKMLGTTFIAEAGIEGGHFQPVTTDSKGFSPLGSFLGMGLSCPSRICL
ncbi:MAG TPA: hypothetical protein PLZ86_04695 [bacterium]|nr:hypothetical protein [bacterium]